MSTSSKSQFNDYNKTIQIYAPNAIVHNSPILTSSMESYGQSSRHIQIILSSSDFDSICSWTTFIAALFAFNFCWSALDLVRSSAVFSGRCCCASSAKACQHQYWVYYNYLAIFVSAWPFLILPRPAFSYDFAPRSSSFFIQISTVSRHCKAADCSSSFITGTFVAQPQVVCV